MILITGSLGFIGLNTTRALLALRETCVLTRLPMQILFIALALWAAPG